MRQYEVYEMKVKGHAPEGSQVDVNIIGLFEMNGKKTEVKGFYAGEDTWIVRFYPEETGSCKYQIIGLDGAGEKIEQTGCVECQSAAAGRHGIVRPKGTHFRYADGTWFYPYDHWGFSKLSREEALIYLDYVTRRLSAYPNIWWSMANEYDLLEYEKADWECFARFLHENDPYGHLLSCHQIVRPWDFSNPYTTHICHQTSAIELLSGEIQKYQKPLMVDECCYEGNVPMNWGNISGFEMVHRFWTVCMQGGYCTHGETYLNEEEILWWSKGGKLIGESPARIGFLKGILEALPGPLTFSGKDYTEESFEEMKRRIPKEQRESSFVRLMLKVSWDEAKGMLNAGREYEANCGDEVYMKYYGRHCTCQGKLVLPKDKSYDVEVIDIWEMTRRTVLENVTGEIQIPLPGKEGIAVMARKYPSI